MQHYLRLQQRRPGWLPIDLCVGRVCLLLRSSVVYFYRKCLLWSQGQPVLIQSWTGDPTSRTPHSVWRGVSELRAQHLFGGVGAIKYRGPSDAYGYMTGHIAGGAQGRAAGGR